MKLVSLLALVMTAVSAVLLYLGVAPVPGTIRFVGGGRTWRDVKAAERRRTVQLMVGFALLALSAVAQAVVIYRGR